MARRASSTTHSCIPVVTSVPKGGHVSEKHRNMLDQPYNQSAMPRTDCLARVGEKGIE